MSYPNSNNHWCKVCLEEVRKAHYDHTKMRDINLRKNYQGFSGQDYDALFLKQGGACAVCGNQQKCYLHVDHDHTTGVVRGLLCSDCNTALGHLHDSPEIICNLLQYISQYVDEEQP
jgi:Autographiviridae endonuclease VII